jgi:hypothetical protein
VAEGANSLAKGVIHRGQQVGGCGELVETFPQAALSLKKPRVSIHPQGSSGLFSLAVNKPRTFRTLVFNSSLEKSGFHLGRRTIS